MAFVLLGHTHTDEIVLVSTEAFDDRQQALRALGSLAADRAAVPDDTDVILVDLHSASPVVIVQPQADSVTGGGFVQEALFSGDDLRSESGETSPDQPQAAQPEDGVRPEAATRPDLAALVPEVHKPKQVPAESTDDARAPARHVVPEVAQNVEPDPHEHPSDSARKQDDATGREAGESPDRTADAATEESPGEPTTTLEEVESDLRELLSPTGGTDESPQRTDGTDASSDSTPAPDSDRLDSIRSGLESETAPSTQATVASDADPTSGSTDDGAAVATDTAPAASPATTALAPWPWQHAAAVGAALSAAVADPTPVSATEDPRAKASDDTSVAVAEKPGATQPSEPSSKTGRAKKPRARSKKRGSSTAAKDAAPQATKPMDVEEFVAKLGRLTDELPPDLAPRDGSARAHGRDSSATPDPAFSDLNCTDCVYVETCPHSSDRTPAECGSFQWQAS